MIPDNAVRETWQSIEGKSRQLAASITAASERFDTIIVLPRGGYVPALIIASVWDFKATELIQASVASYPGDSTERTLQFETGQMPPPAQVKGKRLLVIDEVCETGHTLAYIKDYLERNGAQEVKTAVIHYKPARSQTGFVPDWFVEQTDKWIVYPWELAAK